MLRRSVECLLALMLFGVSTSFASSLPEPYVATYTVQWRGMTAGTSIVQLTRTGPQSYTYTSRNVARGIFRLAIPDAVTQESEFRIEDDQVVPQRYRADDGSSDTRRDVQLTFDWEAGKVVGTAENKPVDEPLPPGTQDSLSVQIALMRALAAGSPPDSFMLIDKDEVKRYDYVREGTEQIKTPLGEFETIVYQSQREGSSRLTRLWLAPDLGYLPVRAQQLRRGRPEFTMQIRSLERNGTRLPPEAGQ